ncbi:QcrA and Rieske domain-containing protein [Paenibacillus apiarius]|uniref:Ubiquinol-cytochrome c reductase iron-sulfur subunit n=1 Tax=Paenibacillus apiarius TaxID=46240 RepID=A0ABT4DS71_9BACL|nr:ubiquinol-cytochrome c reductase iron-sulfur subunit [Paenibacillus apiarius]MBN3527603.1 ubiquinol-cytochrome c reductase iron-sulfur subunit [Paenibacillus apiarius]MCY9517091.1 ubiquinol-cytochrome c reductase iron-sulfur subunit [Paenibacillus apiarius]MCY9520212.1 ubiquinol-cytochrome c reductase iron-sulfur subunit [Paenibacillus apiarius]MCY9554900.1 ubiquinol-cytochrome c reductase iron-sulfur subunit [Paenibacillus apiarius]MCY9561411.1 ubiquinol-cytochrome c reductase iron-sulfur 
MSKPHDNEQSPQKPGKEMSRRQFLTYTLGGASAFMFVGPAIPMVRFAVDPLLQKKTEGKYIKVVEANKITNDPQEFTFEITQIDGWYESKPTLIAWISKDQQGNIFALSPVCKHLGCTVDWNNNPKLKDQYFCPCHGAHYTREGKQLAVARAPLDEYKVKVENGFVYLGDIIPNQHVQ